MPEVEGRAKLKPRGSLQTLIQYPEIEEMAPSCAKGSLYWALGEKNLMERIVKHRNRLSREVVHSSSLEVVWHLRTWFNEHGGGAGLMAGH